MNKIRTSIIIKSFAWILIAVSGLSFVGSMLAVIGMQENNFYEASLEEIRANAYQTYSDRYSAQVLDELVKHNGSSQEYFKNKNFKYGVIQANSYAQLERMYLQNPNPYLESNFDGEIPKLEEMNIFQCAIEEDTVFSNNHPESLWGFYRIHRVGAYDRNYAVNGYVYDYNSGVFYYEAAGSYYPIPNILLHLESNRETKDVYLNYQRKENGYRLADSFENMDNDNVSVLELFAYDADIVQYEEALVQESIFNFQLFEEFGIKINQLESPLISSYGKDRESVFEVQTEMPAGPVATEVTELLARDNKDSAKIELSYEYLSAASIVTDKTYFLDAGGVLEVWSNESPAENYFVISYVPQTLLAYEADWRDGDLFVKFEHVIAAAYPYRYKMITFCGISLLLYLASFFVLCCTAGYRRGESGLRENWLNKVPLEIYGAAVFAAELIAVQLLLAVRYYISDLKDTFWMLFAAVLVLFMGLLLTAAALEVITRIKLHTLFLRTVCYSILKKVENGLKRILIFARENFSMLVRISVIFIGSCAAELIIFLIFNQAAGVGLLLFAAEKGLLFLGLLLVSMQLNKLKTAGKQMAAGDLDYKVETDGMFWDFKQHGVHLNSIGEGLSAAVDDRMKSEHFKTELITNVSHDIKTPLTSIINYVDLLKKEELQNTHAKEYLDVLSRQSARLKKLLEDLMEASKASTGTLPVELEILEAGVFLVQTVGEFEEKTKAQGLELLIKKPEEPLYIKADGRHFWRVIDNLMNNICKYAQPGSRVYINLEGTEQEVFLIFRNTSRYPLNISSEELMERFVRGDSSRNTEGSGLGLSIAQSLMELMDGRFQLVVDGDLFKVVLTFDRVKKYADAERCAKAKD